ncbi:MAG TPA: mycofactocin biosynthesis chaperone MftB [Actinobacteria bacterium]|nr:mycofactocin biosynthesis chaperone MftB [Actinomycetota bacterium]
MGITSRFDETAAWALHASVSVRPERFGALLYDFRTRRLTFVKDPMLTRVLTCLAEYGTPQAAFAAVGVPEEAQDRYLVALARLAETEMLTRTSGLVSP